MLTLSRTILPGSLLAVAASRVMPALFMRAQQKNYAETPAATAAASEEGNSQRTGGITEALIARVGLPSQLAIDQFKKAGMQDVAPHPLTAEERGKVERALSPLPALIKRVLEKKLLNLTFVDGIPGDGTGLTSLDPETGLFDITLRASIIDESLSTFLTTKERRIYTDDGSGMSVTVTGTGTNALTYVLLHESSHVLDKGCGITSDLHSGFVAGIWTSHWEMAPSSAKIAPFTYFRDESKGSGRERHNRV
jgi:hypothetical protein